MLEKIHGKIQPLTCLNDKEKLNHVKQKGVGHEDILALATSRYNSQMIPGAIRWPQPAILVTSRLHLSSLATLPPGLLLEPT